MRRGFEILTVMLVIFGIFLPGCGKEEKPTVTRRESSFQKPAGTKIENGWKVLFDGTSLDGWSTDSPGAWIIEDCAMKIVGKGFIWTVEQYGNFILECEFKIGKGGNSGIFFRVGDTENEVQTGIELQVYDTAGKPDPDKHDCGAMYDLSEPATNAAKPAGEWNKATITCNDNIITAVMNGKDIINMDVDEWTTPRMNPDGTENKFEKALKDFPRSGYIGFQDHGDPVWYRNVRIKEL